MGRLRLIRAAAPLAVAFALVMQGSALAAAPPADVSITNFMYTPNPQKIALGQSIRWTNNAVGTSHTSTSDGLADGQGTTGLDLWNSGTLSATRMFTFAFTFAGSFPYHCTFHVISANMRGTVKVPVKVKPSSGTLATTFTVTWATVAPTTGSNLVFDVQKKDPGGAFQDWQVGATSLSALFAPGFTGVYRFRARVRNMSTGVASGFSPSKSITVS